MTLKLITGPVTTLHCRACNAEGVGGTDQFTSAATGETREPQKWYADLDSSNAQVLGVYCVDCAAKIAEAEDPTRSVTQFYSNTTGKAIEPEHM